MMQRLKKINLMLVVLTLVGCADLSGVGGTSSFKCKMPANSGGCNSITGTYLNTQPSTNDAKPVITGKTALALPDARAVPYSGLPVRSNPTVLRIWIAPWEDSDGDLHDQSFTYMAVDAGKWQIEYNRRNLVQEYQPFRLVGAEANKAAASKKNNATTSPAVSDADVLKKIPGLPASVATQLLPGDGK